MNKEVLNSLKDGEQVVEMSECVLHNETVIKVIVYKCHIKIKRTGFFKIKSIEQREFDRYEYPFYFSSKEFAQDFIENCGNFNIYQTTYYDDKDIPCYGIKLSKYDTHLTYIMVDSFKLKNENYFHSKCQLTERGVWGGVINTDGRYYTHTRQNIKYKDILKFENIAEETGKTYTFKLVTQ